MLINSTTPIAPQFPNNYGCGDTTDTTYATIYGYSYSIILPDHTTTILVYHFIFPLYYLTFPKHADY